VNVWREKRSVRECGDERGMSERKEEERSEEEEKRRGIEKSLVNI